jgi:hypothetical protein
VAAVPAGGTAIAPLWVGNRIVQMGRAIALLAVLVAFGSAACGDDNSITTTTAPRQPKAPTATTTTAAPLPTLDQVRLWAVDVADPYRITGVELLGATFRVNTTYARSTEARIAGIGLCNELVDTHKVPVVEVAGTEGVLLASNEAAGQTCADRFCVQPHREPPSCFPEPGAG